MKVNQTDKSVYLKMLIIQNLSHRPSELFYVRLKFNINVYIYQLCRFKTFLMRSNNKNNYFVFIVINLI